MYLHHNGVQVEESEFVTYMYVGDSGDYITDQASRTVVSFCSTHFVLSIESASSVMKRLWKSENPFLINAKLFSYKYKVRGCFWTAKTSFSF